jgi:hypothetical protein
VTLALDGAVVRYRTSRDLDRDSYTALLQATRRLSRRATGTFDFRGESALTNRTIGVGGDGPLLAGMAGIRTQSAVSTLVYRSSRATTVGFRGGYQHVAYDTPGLLGGWSATAGGQFGRRAGRGSVLQLDYEARRSEIAARASSSYRASGAWELRLGERVDARFTGGVAVADLEGIGAVAIDAPDVPTTRDVATVGGAVLRLHRTRDRLDAEYQRSIGQLFGRETPELFTTDAVSLAYDRAVTTGLHLRALARQVWGVQRGAADHRLQTTEGLAELRYLARRGLVYNLSVLTSRRADVLTVDGRRVTLGVGYGWSQLRSIPPTTDLQ